jgi:hypothetical protein
MPDHSGSDKSCASGYEDGRAFEIHA